MDTSLLIFILFAFFLLIYSVRQTRSLDNRSQALVRHWAKKNGLEILQMHRPSSPSELLWIIGFPKLETQRGYIVKVQNRYGQQTEAYILCGDWLGRMTLDSIKVQWKK